MYLVRILRLGDCGIVSDRTWGISTWTVSPAVNRGVGSTAFSNRFARAGGFARTPQDRVRRPKTKKKAKIMWLSCHVVIVTGAASGIDFSVAYGLAKEGSKLLSTLLREVG